MILFRAADILPFKAGRNLRPLADRYHHASGIGKAIPTRNSTVVEDLTAHVWSEPEGADLEILFHTKPVSIPPGESVTPA